MTGLDPRNLEMRRRSLEAMRRGRAETYRCSKCGSDRATRAKDGSWFWCGVCGWSGDPGSFVHPGFGTSSSKSEPHRNVTNTRAISARSRVKPSPRVEASADWRVASASRTSSSGPSRVVLVERFPTTDPADGEFRVWCEGLLDDETWTLVDDVEWEGGLFTLHFPPGRYEGMPVRQELRRPLKPSVGSPLQLLREDGKPYATLVVTDVQLMTDEQRPTFERRFHLETGEVESGSGRGARFGQARSKKSRTRDDPTPDGQSPAGRAPKKTKEAGGEKKKATNGRVDERARVTRYTTKVLRALPQPSDRDVKRMARRLWNEARADDFHSLVEFLNPLNIGGSCLVPEWDDDNPEATARASLRATVRAIEFALGTSVLWLPYQIYDEQKATAKYMVCIRTGEFAGGRIFLDELPSLNLFELAGHGSIDLTIFRIDGPKLTKSEVAKLKAEIRADYLADLDRDEVTFHFSNPESVYIEVEIRVRSSRRKTHAKKRVPALTGQRGKVAPVAPPATPRLQVPSGRWTVVRFENGASEPALSALVIETLMAARTRRAAGEKWVAILGEILMNEGVPVLMFSPQIPTDVVRSMGEFFDMFGPVTVRRAERSSLLFRGQTLVWLQDDFERSYPAEGS